MSDFVVTVKDEVLQARLRGFPGKIHANVLVVMKRLAIEVQRSVMEDKLTGQVLNVRTGTLRRSINQRVVDSAGIIRGQIGTNVSYARVHEYGFKGPVNVREHLRSIKEAWGKPLREAREVLVMAHSRNVDLPERSFLRSALREFEGKIHDDIKSAALAALK